MHMTSVRIDSSAAAQNRGHLLDLRLASPFDVGSDPLYVRLPGEKVSFCGLTRSLLGDAPALRDTPSTAGGCVSVGRAPVFYPLSGLSPEMQGFGGSTYRPSYRHPGVATCSLGNPGPILGSAATGTARSAVGGSFQTFLAEHRARATGVSL